MFCTSCGAGLAGDPEKDPVKQADQVARDNKPGYRLVLIALVVAVIVPVIVATQLPYAQAAALENVLTLALGVFVAAGIILGILGAIFCWKKQ